MYIVWLLVLSLQKFRVIVVSKHSENQVELRNKFHFLRRMNAMGRVQNKFTAASLRHSTLRTINSYQPSKKAGLARVQVKGHNDVTRVAILSFYCYPGKTSQLESLR